MSAPPILPIALSQTGAIIPGTAPSRVTPDFAHMLTDGIAVVQDRLSTADHMVKRFIFDDSIPVHQVSFALEQAKLGLELMLQVRARLVEGYQQFMTMQM